MENLQNLLNFIYKENNKYIPPKRTPPRRNPSLGSLPPRPEVGKPEDPLAAYKISRRATRQSEREGKAEDTKTSNTEKFRREFPKSDETPM